MINNLSWQQQTKQNKTREKILIQQSLSKVIDNSLQETNGKTYNIWYIRKSVCIPRPCVVSKCTWIMQNNLYQVIGKSTCTGYLDISVLSLLLSKTGFCMSSNCPKSTTYITSVIIKWWYVNYNDFKRCFLWIWNIFLHLFWSLVIQCANCPFHILAIFQDHFLINSMISINSKNDKHYHNKCYCIQSGESL